MTSSITFAEHPAILKAKRQAKEKMSITQTFVLAHKARGKLSREASKPDHDLRHLVLTANLLDSLMLHLSQVEQDQEAHFNSMVREEATDAEMATATASLGAISEDAELAFDYSDSESDSEDEDEEENVDDDDDSDSFVTGFPVYTTKSLITIKVTAESDDEEYEEDEEEDDGFYALQRVPSRAPSLVEDASDSDEDESNPPSPRHSFVVPALTEKERQSLVTTSFYDETEEETSPISYLDIHHQLTSLISAY